jgi:hypothetical protein
MNEQTTVEAEVVNDAEPKKTETADTIVDAVFDIGEAWAAYGLKVGRMALLTSARTLSHAARALEAVQKNLEKQAEPQDPKTA